MRAEYPDVEVKSYHIGRRLQRAWSSAPETLDVVVAPTCLAIILTDLGAAIQGGLGFAASATHQPGAQRPFDVRARSWSAPDIAHLGIANPIATIWSGAMMLDHLGEQDAAAAIMKAIETASTGGIGTVPGGARTGRHHRSTARCAHEPRGTDPCR